MLNFKKVIKKKERNKHNEKLEIFIRKRVIA